MKVNLNLGRLALMLAATVMGLAISASVNAQTVLIDLGNDQGYRSVDVPNPDVNGNYWNSVWSGAYYGNLTDINGSPSGVAFGFSSAAGNDSYNGPAGATDVNGPGDSVYNAAALGNLGVQNAVYDYYVSSTFQIQLLDPLKSYDLTFFGSHKYNADNTTRYTIYDDGTFSNPVTSADLIVGVNDAHNQDTTVTISGVSPQPDGIIYVGFAAAGGGDGYLNALQINAIPEPSSLLLMASAAGLSLIRRRR